ncbi:tRNA threonylcarbamoyladenosine dehydratase [Bacteriovoracaceae bacterium]|nr:tRNA threonylcarbamoyladenosine dehydratase [Bacteriovoracaceae bacterium]
MSDTNMSQSIYQGTAALLGKDSLVKLSESHVAIVGLGGVGSWAVEVLARTGVGRITLMDLDENCLSNINRQIQATMKNVGEPKVQSLKERIQLINPEIEINPIQDFFDEKTKNDFFKLQPTLVLDCIDSLSAKCLLLKECYERKIDIITCGGMAGKRMVDKIVCEDLNQTINDPLLYRVRKSLRKENIFYPRRNKKFRIPCIYSKEVPSIKEPTNQKNSSQCDSYQGSLMSMVATVGIHMGHMAINQLIANINE